MVRVLLALVVLGLASWIPAVPAVKFHRQLAIKIKANTSAQKPYQDRHGNVYLIGTTADLNNFDSNDWFVAKWDKNGVKKWHRTFNGKGSGFDQPNDIVVDRLGGVYVCGFTTGQGPEGSVAALVKWDTNGNRKWVVYRDGPFRSSEPSNSYDDYRSMQVDYLNNVYVAGSHSATPNSGTDMLVEKYSQNGLRMYSRTWDGGFGRMEQGLFLALNPNGYCYVLGEAPKASEFTAGLWTITPQGTVQKFERVDGNGTNGSQAVGLEFQAGRVYALITIRGTSLFLNNEGTPVVLVNNFLGNRIQTRLVKGNSTISRYGRRLAVRAWGDYSALTSTEIAAQTYDVLAQVFNWDVNGAALPTQTVNLPNFVTPHGIFPVGPNIDLSVYETNYLGHSRAFIAPTVGGILRNGDRAAATLIGQTIRDVAAGPDGIPMVSVNQTNGSAAIRQFEPLWFLGSLEMPAEASTTLNMTVIPGRIPTQGQSVHIQFYRRGSYIPLITKEISWGEDPTMTVPINIGVLPPNEEYTVVVISNHETSKFEAAGKFLAVE